MYFSKNDIGEIIDSLDVYSNDGCHLGVRNRKEVHDLGLLHYSIHCWVFGTFAGSCYVAFQKRKKTKRLFPSKYDVAAAGHYVSGEYGRDGLRELVEELGLPLSAYDICYYETRECKFCDSIIKNNEKCNVYLCNLLDSLCSISFKQEEIDDIIIGDVRSFLRLFTDDVCEISVHSLRNSNDIIVYKDDFIVSYLPYFTETLLTIMKRYSSAISLGKGAIKKKNYTFVMLKPDAIERNLVPQIIKLLNQKGYTIELFDIRIPTDDEIYSHYSEKILEEGEIYKVKASKYFHNKYVVPMVLSNESETIIQDVRELVGFKDPYFADKSSIRGRWGIDTMALSEKEIRSCENLIHASDSKSSFLKETMLWFKRDIAEQFVL